MRSNQNPTTNKAEAWEFDANLPPQNSAEWPKVQIEKYYKFFTYRSGEVSPGA